MPKDASLNSVARVGTCGAVDEGIGDAGQAPPLGGGRSGRRFDDLFNFVYDPATLIVAFERVATNGQHPRCGRSDGRRRRTGPRHAWGSWTSCVRPSRTARSGLCPCGNA